MADKHRHNRQNPCVGSFIRKLGHPPIKYAISAVFFRCEEFEPYGSHLLLLPRFPDFFDHFGTDETIQPWAGRDERRVDVFVGELGLR